MRSDQYEKNQRMVRQLQKELSVFPYPGASGKQEQGATNQEHSLPPWRYPWEGAVAPDEKTLSGMRERARRLGLCLEYAHQGGCIEISLVTPLGSVVARERIYAREPGNKSTFWVGVQPGALDFYKLRIESAYREYENSVGTSRPDCHALVLVLRGRGLTASTPRDWVGVLDYMDSGMDSFDLEDERVARFLGECWHTARNAIRSGTRRYDEYVQEIKGLLDGVIGELEVLSDGNSMLRKLYTARMHIGNLDASIEPDKKLEYLRACRNRLREAFKNNKDQAVYEKIEELLDGLEVSIRGWALLEKTRPIVSKLRDYGN